MLYRCTALILVRESEVAGLMCFLGRCVFVFFFLMAIAYFTHHLLEYVSNLGDSACACRLSLR